MNALADFCELFVLLDKSSPQQYNEEQASLATRLIQIHDDDGDDVDEIPTVMYMDDDSRSSLDSNSDFSEQDELSSSMEQCDLDLEQQQLLSPPPSSSRHVSFADLVLVREYAVVAGECTLMEAGELPLQLDWGYVEAAAVHVDTSKHRGVCYEPPARLTLAMRRDRLKTVSDYTDETLDEIANRYGYYYQPNGLWSRLYTTLVNL